MRSVVTSAVPRARFVTMVPAAHQDAMTRNVGMIIVAVNVLRVVRLAALVQIMGSVLIQ